MDVRATVRWYEAEQDGLGDAFASAIEKAGDTVLRSCPDTFVRLLEQRSATGSMIGNISWA